LSTDGLRGKRVLLTGGRAPAALEMARLLAAAGCEVIAAESTRHHLCRVSRSVKRSCRVPSPAADPAAFADALEEIIAQEGIHSLIPTCEELFFVAASRERLGSQCAVFTAPLAQLQRLHSKAEFIRTAGRLGFNVPMTVRISKPEEWRDFAHSSSFRDMLSSGGCVLKPEYSRFAAKVRIATSRQELVEAASELGTGHYPWVAQQYIGGREICTYSIVHDGKVTAHAAYASELSAYGGASVYFEPLRHPAAQAWAARFAELERFTGQLAFDLIEQEDGSLMPIECNPRTTSGIHLLAGNPGIAEALLLPQASSASAPVEPRPDKRVMLALPMLAAGLSGRLRGKPGRHWLPRWLGAGDATFRWSDPRPALEQLLLARELQRTARRRGLSLIEAATCDIEWNGRELV